MDDDDLLFVDMLSENATMVMRSKKEMFLRIDCGTIPEKKKAAVGVRGMRLDREDELTDIYLLNDCLLYTSIYYYKNQVYFHGTRLYTGKPPQPLYSHSLL